MFKSCFILASTLLLSTPLFATTTPPINEHTLDNGLRIIVQENHRAPVVVSMIWYKVGSADEPGGVTGVSHALEHMMYKGTTDHPEGAFSLLVASKGGEENAFTSHDFTAYYQKLSNADLETSFALESDRMRHLILNEDDFSSEIKVIQEERRMRTDDNPHGLTYERLMATAHLAAPYQHPIIGWMNDLENMQVSDLQQWYQRWYAPNNAILVIAGDVNSAEVFALAQKYFGDIPQRELPELKAQREPPALGKRNVKVNTIATLPILYLGYNVPSLVTADEAWQAYALDVIVGLLAGSDSARLPTTLIRELGIAADADAYYDLYSRFDNLFMLTAIPAAGYEPDALKSALLEQVQQLSTELVTEKELARIKAQVIAGRVFEQDSLFGQATRIGALESVGLSWETADNYVEAVQAITPEQIQVVAQQFLTVERLTVAELIPEHPSQEDAS